MAGPTPTESQKARGPAYADHVAPPAVFVPEHTFPEAFWSWLNSLDPLVTRVRHSGRELGRRDTGQAARGTTPRTDPPDAAHRAKIALVLPNGTGALPHPPRKL
jgi:hypothetical protein